MFTDAYFPRINGVAISVNTYAEMLSRLGHNVCIVCCNYEDATKENGFKKIYYEPLSENSNVKVLRIPSFKVFFSGEDRGARFEQWRNVKNEMDVFKPDIVHINSEFVVGYFGLTYAKHRRIPMVYTFHTLWEDYVEGYIHFMPTRPAKKISKELIRLYLKRADEIICPTQRIVDVVKQYKIDRATDILPTGIPEELCKIDPEKQKSFLKEFDSKYPGLRDKRILLYVGRVVKEKNIEFLFSVLEEVKKHVPDTVLMIVGGGPELENLQKKAQSLSCAGDVYFTDYQARESLAYYYSVADVFVFPSCTETQGLVTIESMLTGTPVVAIGEMGTVDVMQGDNGGFMVKNSLEEFSEKVISLLSDKKLLKEKKQQALKWGKKWLVSELTPKLVEFYRKAIEIKKNSK